LFLVVVAVKVVDGEKRSRSSIVRVVKEAPPFFFLGIVRILFGEVGRIWSNQKREKA